MKIATLTSSDGHRSIVMMVRHMMVRHMMVRHMMVRHMIHVQVSHMMHAQSSTLTLTVAVCPAILCERHVVVQERPRQTQEEEEEGEGGPAPRQIWAHRDRHRRLCRRRQRRGLRPRPRLPEQLPEQWSTSIGVPADFMAPLAVTLRVR